MMPIEEAGKDTWNPSSPSGNNLPWALLQPWISAGGNNRDPRYPAGQQLPGGAWQDVDGYYGGGRRGGASTGESSTALDRVVDGTAQLYCVDWRCCMGGTWLTCSCLRCCGGAGPCVHAFTPSDCFAVPTGEW